MRTILFICTGNTCRSPMAEAIAQDWMDRELAGESAYDRDQGIDGNDGGYLAVSAGVATGGGTPATMEARQALAEIGLSQDGRSTPLTADMIRNAEAVFAMTEDHVRAARELVEHDPDLSAKIQRLDPAGDAHDPIGQGQEAYDRLVKHFRELIPRRLREVFLHEDRAGIGSSRH